MLMKYDRPLTLFFIVSRNLLVGGQPTTRVCRCITCPRPIGRSVTKKAACAYRRIAHTNHEVSNDGVCV